jgi:hypothetical protein
MMDPNVNKNSSLMVGTEGRIYRMVNGTSAVYNVDNRTVEQGSLPQTSQNVPTPVAPTDMADRVRNLLNPSLSPGTRNLPTCGLLQNPITTGNIRGFHSSMTFPSVGDGASVIQPQTQIRLFPDVPVSTLSSLNPIATKATGNPGFVLSTLGDNITSTGLAPPPNFALNAPIQVPILPTAFMPVAGYQDDFSPRARRRVVGVDDGSFLEPSSKRMRMAPLEALQGVATDTTRVTRTSHARCFSLYIDSDKDNLSQYQCLGRKQIEIFESTPEDASTNKQGRNRPISPGQAGIRCRHCRNLALKQRKTGSVYFPNRVSTVSLHMYRRWINHG